ncbi:MAG: hypothetical protein ACOY91_07025, partial [Pseudomonadota bacterium]
SPTACGTPDANGVTVVTTLVCFLTFAHGAADALAHPAFRAPSLKGEAMKELRAPPRRHNNRGDGAHLQVRAV